MLRSDRGDERARSGRRRRSDPTALSEYRQLLPRYKEIKAQLECLDA